MDECRDAAPAEYRVSILINTALGMSSTALGMSNTALGMSNTALGMSNTTLGRLSQRFLAVQALRYG